MREGILAQQIYKAKLLKEKESEVVEEKKVALEKE